MGRPMRCVIRSGLIQLVLVTSFVAPPPQIVRAQDRDRADTPGAVDDARIERQRLYGEILKNREMMNLLLQMQGRALQDPQVRAEQEEREQQMIEESLQVLQEAAEFSSEEGEKLRTRLRELATGIDQIPITTTTSKEQVDSVLSMVREGQRAIVEARRQALEGYQQVLGKLGQSARAILNSEVKPEELKKLGEERLREVLSKLDPSLTAEQLAKYNLDQLAAEVAKFALDGRWSPELIAAIGLEALKQYIYPNLDITEEEAEQVENAARTLVDVHRSGADFADFSVQLLTAAMATGNPYVIAAAAAIVILLAIFKNLFGGGGGGGGDGDGDGTGQGDQPGDGSGTGSTGRNQGAGETDRQPAPGGTGREGEAQERDADLAEEEKTVPPLPTGDVPLPSLDGPLHRYLEGLVLHVLDRQARTEIFTSNLGQVNDPAGELRIQPGNIKNISEIVVEQPYEFRLDLRDGTSVTIVQKGDGWTVIRGTEIPAVEGGEIGPFEARFDGRTLILYKGTEQVETIAPSDVRFLTASGELRPFAFDAANVTDTRSYDEAQKRLTVNYRFEPGKDPSEDVVLRYQPELMKWIISRSDIPQP